MKITKSYLRSILLEVILLEIKSTDILNKYPGMNKPEYGYAEAVDMIRNKNKYLRFLDKMLGQFVSDATGNYVLHQNISYGQIIFCVLMHEKYSAQKGVLPDEYLDPNKITHYKMLIQIIDYIDARFMQKNKPAYEKLVAKDRAATEGEAESGDSEINTAEILAQKYEEIGGDLNEDVSGGIGLIKHASIDGWDILRPYTTPGAQAIGVYSWCTVYGGHWDTYTSQGWTLYYVSKQKPGRTYDGTTQYDRSTCYNDSSVYNDNFSIGFTGATPNSIVINEPGVGGGGASVWGNQKGVSQESLDKILGVELAQKIITYIKGHFTIKGQTSTSSSNEQDAGSTATAQNRRMQDLKPTRARARSKTVFKEHLETLAEPNDRMAFVMNILRSTHLSPAVLDYIYMRNVPRVKDSRMAQSDLATEGIFPYIVISLVNAAHTEVSKKTKESIAYLTLTDDLLFNPVSEESKTKRNDIILKLKNDYEVRGLLDPPMDDQSKWDFVPRSQFRRQQGSLGLFNNMFFSSVVNNERICDLLISKVTDNMELILYDHKVPGIINELAESLKRLSTGGVKADKVYRKFEEIILAGKFDDILDDRIKEIFGFYLTPESKQMSDPLKELVKAMTNMVDSEQSDEKVKKYILDKFLPIMEETFKEAEDYTFSGSDVGGDMLKIAATLLPGLHFPIMGHVNGDYELPPRALELIELATNALIRSHTQYNYVFRDMLVNLSKLPGFDVGTSEAMSDFAKYYIELCKILTPWRKELLDAGVVKQMNFIPDPSEKLKIFLRFVDKPEDTAAFYETMFNSIQERPSKTVAKINDIGLNMSKNNPMDVLQKIELIENGYDQIKLQPWSLEAVQENQYYALLYPPLLSSLFFSKVMDEAHLLLYPLIKYKPDLYRMMVKDTIAAMKYVDNDNIPYSLDSGVSSRIPTPQKFYPFLGEKLNLSYKNGLKGLKGYGMPYSDYVATFKAITEVPIQAYAESDIEIKPGYSQFNAQFNILASGDIRMPSMLSEDGLDLDVEEESEEYYD